LCLLLVGCGSSSLCSTESDLSGSWTFRLEPTEAEGSIARSDLVTAQLEQVQPGAFSLGRLLWGSLSSQDKGFFDTLAILRLVSNNGLKTGSLLGCNVSINIPIRPDQSDDNSDPGPLKLSLNGSVIALGQMAGRPDRPSTVVMDEDASQTPKGF